VTGWSDLPDEMRKVRLDGDTVDRLLSGRMSPDDAPPGYSEVARVLNAAAENGFDELLWEAEHVAAAAALVEPASASPSPYPTKMKARSATRLKVGATLVGAAMLASTGLAAAGVLPDAARDAVSRILETVGITKPPDADRRTTTGDEISGIATTTDAVGVEKGEEISSAASDGRSRAGQHGSGSDRSEARGAEGTRPEGTPADGTPAEGSPPVPTPNEGGTGTADAASGGASEAGTQTADEKSDGASSAGSANASDKRPAPPETPATQRPELPAHASER
jgi:hypothetical protein